ncbi:hypothetical protein GCK72_004498 [Caenorhabditis remanei]|uniref:Uncharacterized protein n=1 Tax=Caenorhabditis remanei TaxID=31234 RepID=A0A6A5HC00_CAERE|nr:hypothetical protein GCK72_004498 [Caenorhabditis remanei]KAF1764549.1 hypothetical protein GCK72_004498 [Caenorhabditis remanei]
MAQFQQDYESSGYSTSASSEFGSLDERIQLKFPPATIRNASKRRAEENMEQLDTMMKASLVLSPEKRLRLDGEDELARRKKEAEEFDPIIANKAGRPPTRRSTSQDIDRSPRVRALRALNTGSTIDQVRIVSGLSSDSISPKLIGEASPRRHFQFNENGSIYSKHRLGATFSPLVAGAKRKIATPSQTMRGLNPSPVDSPRRGGLRNRGTPRANLMLSDRFKMLD